MLTTWTTRKNIETLPVMRCALLDTFTWKKDKTMEKMKEIFLGQLTFIWVGSDRKVCTVCVGDLKAKRKNSLCLKLSLSYSPPTLILKMLLSRLCQCAVLYSPSFMPPWWSQRFKTWKKLFFWQPNCSFTARSPKGWPPVINSNSFMQTLTNQKLRTVSSWLLIGLNL